MAKLFKKKGFVIDKISEDSFYENFLLGLPCLLKKCPLVSHITLKRYFPATIKELSEWESTNDVALPTDLRSFFLSNNGFLFSYTFHYDKSVNDSNTVTASIEINPLCKMEKLSIEESMYATDGGTQILSPNSKIHVLANLEDNNCVVLAQFNPTLPLTIWLYFKRKVFYFLCENIGTYFRMAIAHVGVPGWQLLVLNATLPEWSADMIQILAPGIMNNRQLFENGSELNKIDCDIFNLTNDLELISDEGKLESVAKRKGSAKHKPKK